MTHNGNVITRNPYHKVATWKSYHLKHPIAAPIGIAFQGPFTARPQPRSSSHDTAVEQTPPPPPPYLSLWLDCCRTKSIQSNLRHKTKLNQTKPAMRFLHLIRPVMCVLPEVAQPDRKVRTLYILYHICMCPT